MTFFIVNLQNEPKRLVRLADFEIFNLQWTVIFYICVRELYYCNCCAYPLVKKTALLSFLTFLN